MNSTAHAGFVYTVEVVKDGVVIDREIVHNVMPTQGADQIILSALAGGAQVTTWYLGLYEGNYTPTIADTAAALPGLATECSAYVGATRKTWTPGAVAGGSTNNSAAKAEFAFTAPKTVYGGFLSSSPAKGSTAGVLVSAVRFPSPKVLDTDSILRVTAGITLTPV